MLIAVELLALIVFFPFLTHTFLFSLALSALFLTLFSHVVLRLYYQAKKITTLHDIKQSFTCAIADEIRYQRGDPDSHILMAQACCRLADQLDGIELRLYSHLGNFWNLASYLAPLSQRLHCQDTHRLREMVLQAAVAENIEFVKCAATSFEAHSSLANSYVLLSYIYNGSATRHSTIPAGSAAAAADLKAKFHHTVERAIEEFKILNEYNPNDSWVHQQLAYSYHDLGRPMEEIAEYEIVLKLKPNDVDTLYKLGMLNFQLGRNARGLQAYEQLKRLHPPKAEALIKYYGTVQIA